MSNTNCLEGKKCPACGQEDYFRIAARVWADVTDDGATADDTDYEWDEESAASCGQCDWSGTVGDLHASEADNA